MSNNNYNNHDNNTDLSGSREAKANHYNEINPENRPKREGKPYVEYATHGKSRVASYSQSMGNRARGAYPKRPQVKLSEKHKVPRQRWLALAVLVLALMVLVVVGFVGKSAEAGVRHQETTPFSILPITPEYQNNSSGDGSNNGVDFNNGVTITTDDAANNMDGSNSTILDWDAEDDEEELENNE